MRVLLAMNLAYLGRPGGALKCNRRLLEGLAAAGHEVFTIVPWSGTGSAKRSRTRILDELRARGVTIREHDGVDVLSLAGVEVHAVADPARLRGELARCIRELAPDRVLVSTEDPGHNLLDVAVATAADRVIYLVHTPTFLPFGPQAFFPSARRSEIVARVPSIITVSQATARYIHEHSGLHAHVGAFPVWGPPPYPQLAQHDRGYVTLINPSAVKGIAIFLQLARELPDVAFAAVPTWGTTERDLEALRAQPNVTLLEPVDDIDKLFAVTRVLLVPSVWHEAFGLVVVEAMLRGIPVLASDAGGLPEAKLGTRFVLPVRPIERFGDVLDENLIPIPEVPAQDITAWREALQQLLADRALYEEESRASARAAETFVRGVSIASWEQLLARDLPARSGAFTVVERDPVRARLAALPPDRLASIAERARSRLAVEAEHLAYWRAHLADAPEPAELPSDRTRVSGDATARHTQLVSASEADTLVAAFAIFVARHRGEDDVVIGASVDGGGIVPVRARLAGARIASVVAACTAALREARTHPQGADAIANAAWPDRDRRRPIFPAVIAHAPPAGDCDLWLHVEPRGDTLALHWCYRPSRFDPVTIERFARRFARLLEVMRDPSAPADRASVMPDDERRLLLGAWNATAADHDRRDIVTRFEEQVDRDPERVAVRCEGTAITYAELDARANRIAHQLAALGVRRGVEVAVCLERSVDMIAALLGVVKAGGCYLPLDPENPRDRLSTMLADAGCAIAIVDPAGRAALGDPRCATLDVPLSGDGPASRLGVAIDPEQPVYAIYTSGSTGNPKRVINRHAGLANRLWWMQQAYAIGDGDRVVQKTPFTFDVSVWELFWPIITGATLVMARPGGHRDPRYLVELFEREAITTAHFVPSMLEIFLEEPDLERCVHLRRVICSGEALGPELVDRLLSRLPIELHNLYGPTEASIDVSYHHCQRGRARTPIGRPIANTQLHVLDRDGDLAPIGVEGELHIGGIGLALGYGGRPALTAERFIPDPLGAPGSRLYRTGDRARWTSDGELEYLGRFDHQIKLRGHRIELGEIEAVLARHDDVQKAVVAVCDDPHAGPQLVAYLVPRAGHTADAAGLRAFLARQLPESMLPAAYVALDELPLTPSGKLDRKRLPAPIAAPRQLGRAPRDELERKVAAIWERLFGRAVAIDEEFFDAGGHSLMAVRLVSRIEAELGVRIPLTLVFESATIESIATELRSGRRTSSRRAHPQRDAISHVLVLSTEYPPLMTGGLGTHVRELALGLCAAGIAVDVAVDPMYVKDATVPLGSTHPVRVHVVDASARSHNQEIVRMVRGVIEAHGVPDVIHCHDPYLFAAAAELRALYGVPVVGTLHMPAKAIRIWTRAAWTAEHDELEADFCAGVDRLVCVSASVDEVTRRSHAAVAPSDVIHNAFDPSAFATTLTAERREALRAELAPGGEAIVMYAGRLYQAKGTVELFAAAAQLLDAGRRIRFVFAGEPLPFFADELQALLQRHAAHRDAFVLLGTVERARLPDLYSVADVAVVPSLYEPFGYAVLEAMAAGAPLVATRSGGPGEIIEHGETGLLVPVAERDGTLHLDAEQLARAIDELVIDRAKARDLAAAARRRAGEFTVSTMIDRTLDAYRAAKRSFERPELVASGARVAPLVAPQRGTFKLDQDAPDNQLIRASWSLWLDGELDPAPLERALLAMRERHAVLRSRFFERDGQAWQEVLAPDEVEFRVLEHVDLRALPAADHERADRELHEAFTRRPFALARGEVLRAMLVAFSPTRHRLTISVHRIACDFESIAVFTEELAALWRGLALSPVPIQYVELADYLARLASSQAGQAQRAFWEQRLANVQPLELPIDMPRDEVDARRDRKSGFVTFPIAYANGELAVDAVRDLERVARAAQASVQSTLLAALAAYLHRRTGQHDLAFVSHLVYRHLPGLERAIGQFANPLVMRVDAAGAPTFRELVARTHEVVTSAFENGECDVLGLAPYRVFRLFFNYLRVEPAEKRELALPAALASRPAPLPNQDPQIAYDLLLFAWRHPDRVPLQLAYNRMLFHADGAAALLADYIETVTALCRDPDARIE